MNIETQFGILGQFYGSLKTKINVVHVLYLKKTRDKSILTSFVKLEN